MNNYENEKPFDTDLYANISYKTLSIIYSEDENKGLAATK